MSLNPFRIAYRFAVKNHAAKILLLITLLVSLILSGFTQTKADTTPTPAPKVLIQITAATIVIRSGPGENYQALETVKRGGKIQVSGISTDGNWFMLKYGTGQGWITSDPQASKFLSGSLSDLPTVEYSVSAIPATSTPIPGLQRAKLGLIMLTKPCDGANILIKSIDLSDYIDHNNYDDKGIEAKRDNALSASSMTSCTLIDNSDLQVYQETTVNHDIADEVLISLLYTNLHMSEQARLHNQQASDLIPLGYPSLCTKKALPSITQAILTVYNQLDSTIDSDLASQDSDSALTDLEKMRSEWLKVTNPIDCSMQIVQLSFFTTRVVDETLMATLYLKQGNTTMFTSHAKAAITSVRVVNGLLKQ